MLKLVKHGEVSKDAERTRDISTTCAKRLVNFHVLIKKLEKYFVSRVSYRIQIYRFHSAEKYDIRGSALQIDSFADRIHLSAL